MNNPKPPSLEEISAQIRVQEKRNIESVITIGRLLAAAWEQLDHGEWLTWLKSEFGWSYRTAHRYRAVFEWSKQIDQIGKYDLSISALYLVADPATPADVQQKILETAAKERVSYSTARAILDAHLNAPSPPPPDYDNPEAGDDEQDEPADEPAPPAPRNPESDELIAALRMLIANLGRDLAASVYRAGIESVELIAAANFLRKLAETMRGGDQIKLAADRAEARSRAQRGVAVH